MNTKKAHIIAFYLPQFHPIKENNEWWGEGFTEWTNVGKARPLFHGHYQPHVPADLGYYDLRIPEVREKQANLARKAGIDAFCYWHYWFGGGKQLMEMPLQEVLKLGKPDFPFCLGWANHTWMKKSWNSEVSRFSKEKLIEQTYPGQKDWEDHFNTMLPAFKDERYYKIKGKLAFLLYDPISMPDVNKFLNRWQQLAKEHGLPGFYFIAQSQAFDIENVAMQGFDAINYECKCDFFNNSRVRRLIAYTFKRPIIKHYKKILKLYNLEKIKKNNIYPTVYPNWDNTPRLGYIGNVFKESSPELFKLHVRQILDAICHKPEEDRIIFLKSWNEWAEGNYLEPDLKFGCGYLDALRELLEEYD